MSDRPAVPGPSFGREEWAQGPAPTSPAGGPDRRKAWAVLVVVALAVVTVVTALLVVRHADEKARDADHERVVFTFPDQVAGLTLDLTRSSSSHASPDDPADGEVSADENYLAVYTRGGRGKRVSYTYLADTSLGTYAIGMDWPRSEVGDVTCFELDAELPIHACGVDVGGGLLITSSGSTFPTQDKVAEKLEMLLAATADAP